MLDCLLSQTEKIIIIGWRGTEDNFLELLKKHVKFKRVRVLTIAGSTREAKEVNDKIKPYLADEANLRESQHGFTQSILTREVERFLSQ